ncbi:hypothetical protein NVP1084O_146 [Vibrio phage 1.084.O._10N.261.49.F5]|nr:hypothetical protein NVP1084O_146 [Vibrio phage 1.084.O._10N.261.49.F5]
MSTSGEYGTTIENVNKVIEKAKTKNDGVFTYRGLIYKVKGNRVRHLAAYGSLYELSYGFLCAIGKYDHFKDDPKKLLKNLT